MLELLSEINGEEINKEDMFNFLSSNIFIKIDNQLNEKAELIKKTEKNLLSTKNKINEMKNLSEKIERDYSYYVQLNRVCSLITALKKEGVVTGSLRIKILKLLDEIYKMDFQKLRDVEQKLSVHLPDKYNKF